MTTITALPTPPSRDNPNDFRTRADAFLGALPQFVTETNAVAGEINAAATAASTSATSASGSASAANTSATAAAAAQTAAAASAASAASAPGTSATSTTSLAIGTGSKTLIIQTGKSFSVGMSVKIARTSGATNWMAGDITAHNSSTGELTVSSIVTNGSGTYADWTVSLSGPAIAAELAPYSTGAKSIQAALDERLPEIGNYASLRAYTGSYTAFMVRGVASIFDGGHGVFRVDASDTTSADNGVTILVDAAGRRWKREFLGNVHLRWAAGVTQYPSDCSSAVQAAVTAAKSHGVGVDLPVGKWLMSNISLQQGVELVGVGAAEQGSSLESGTIIYVIDAANPAFKIKRGCAFRRLGIYYPNQVILGSPTAYPFTFQGDTATSVSDVDFEDVIVYNSYQILKLGDAAYTAGHGRIRMRGCQWYGIYKVFELHNVLDVFQIDAGNVFTWGHFDNIAATQTLKNWTAKNGIFAELDRVDGIQGDSGIVYGPHIGLRVINGKTDLAAFSNWIWDACSNPLVVEAGGCCANFTMVGGSLHCYAYGDDTYIGSGISSSSEETIGTELGFSGVNFALARGGFINMAGSTLKTLTIAGCDMGPIGTATGAVGTYHHVAVNDADAVVNIGGGTTFDGNSYAAADPINIVSCGVLNIDGITIKASRTPITITTVGTKGSIQNVTDWGTSGAASVAISAAAKQKVLFGLNHFQKPTPTAVGSPKFLATLSGATTVNSGTDTTIAFGGEVIDTTGSYDAATSTFTAPFPGTYRFGYVITHDNTIAATDRWLVKIKTTAREYQKLYRASAADILSVEGAALVEMAAGDTAKITVARSGGAGSFVTQLDGALSRFCGELVM